MLHLKYVLEIYRKFTGEYPGRSVVSIKLLCKFIESRIQNGCFPLKLHHIFGTPFHCKTSSNYFRLLNIKCYWFKDAMLCDDKEHFENEDFIYLHEYLTLLCIGRRPLPNSALAIW